MTDHPYFQDESVTLWHGDSLAVLRELPDASVNCCVTSPPYFGLRDYGSAGQYGLEASPAEYVETMRAVFAEVRRVLADDGTLWLNLGDSYAGAQPGRNDAGRNIGGRGGNRLGTGNPGRQSRRRDAASVAAPRDAVRGLPSKNLVGIPWRVAFALQDDGWILRNDIIWAKPNAMPESVTDRLSTRHEHVFMFAKSRRYWFDLDPVRVEPDRPDVAHVNRTRPERGYTGHADVMRAGHHEIGRNPGDVWTIPTTPFAAAHFAVFPPALAERCILAGCKPGGTVLDPFSGSGTTGFAANKHGRKYVGIDLSADYLDLSLRTRFAQPGLDFDGGAA